MRCEIEASRHQLVQRPICPVEKGEDKGAGQQKKKRDGEQSVRYYLSGLSDGSSNK